MKRYFKATKRSFPSCPDYLGTILGESGSLTSVYIGGEISFVDGEYSSLLDDYIKRGQLIEITKEEAALLFGFV